MDQPGTQVFPAGNAQGQVIQSGGLLDPLAARLGDQFDQRALPCAHLGAAVFFAQYRQADHPAVKFNLGIQVSHFQADLPYRCFGIKHHTVLFQMLIGTDHQAQNCL